MKLTDKDWALLLPGESVELGKQDLQIVPLSLYALKGVSLRLRHVVKEMGSRKITFDNCLKDKIDESLNVLMTETPELLEAAIGLAADDIKRLPFGKIIEIVDVVIRVNKASKEGLEKNLKSLVAAVPAAINGASEILSSFSSQTDTAGKKSKATPLDR